MPARTIAQSVHSDPSLGICTRHGPHVDLAQSRQVSTASFPK